MTRALGEGTVLKVGVPCLLGRWRVRYFRNSFWGLGCNLLPRSGGWGLPWLWLMTSLFLNL